VINRIVIVWDETVIIGMRLVSSFIFESFIIDGRSFIRRGDNMIGIVMIIRLSGDLNFSFDASEAM